LSFLLLPLLNLFVFLVCLLLSLLSLPFLLHLCSWPGWFCFPSILASWLPPSENCESLDNKILALVLI
jgi:hypothetical protein